MIKNLKLRSILGDFLIEDHTIAYHKFMAQFYNFCIKEGMQPGKITPSRAFCSDESQGLPIILMSKHFGAFPFDHGLVGGIMAHGRHAPHAHHGKDMVILQASHVGYDPQSRSFGHYRRLQTEDQHFSSNCGKIHATLDWYLEEHEFAQQNILLQLVDDQYQITIDKELVDHSLQKNTDDCLYLNLETLIEHETDTGALMKPVKILSTSRVYQASKELVEFLKSEKYQWSNEIAKPIEDHLEPAMFGFRRDETGFNFMLQNLHEYMAWIVTSGNPMLSAAEINVQLEFDKAYRSIVKEESYQGKNLIYIAGLNIDYSPITGQHFPLSQFVPWAAYIQHENGKQRVLEQDELYKALMECSDKNKDQVSLDDMLWD